MAQRNHQNNFSTNVTTDQIAGVTTTPINDIPSVDAPFSIALDATNVNSHYEIVEVTSKTATNINHAATTYAHSTDEEVRMVVGASEFDLMWDLSTNGPQGYLINGKISVTDASGITVAIKTLAGTDPSDTDPVYCRIGDTVRSITSALSVSIADGSNWGNAGSAELATQEIDWFVYLQWEAAASAVVIGFSRFPGGAVTGDFSSTSTNEKALLSSMGAYVTTDTVELIGRFAATLSAGAGYTWSVPTYTAANLIQRPIYETRWLDWIPTISVSAGTAPTYTTVFQNKYKFSFDKCEINVSWGNNSGGTAGNGANAIVTTLPFANAQYQADRSIVGTGFLNESAGTTDMFTCLQSTGSASAFSLYLRTVTAAAGNDQSSTIRFVTYQGFYAL